MKITIDTKEDSHYEIRKVMGLLNDLLDKEQADPRHRSFSEPQENDQDTTSMMSMFDSPETEKKQEVVPDTPPDFSSFLNLANKQKEEKEEDPKVEFF